jgi:hypothetical protein
MSDVKVHLERNLAQAEQLGQTERVKKIKARLDDLEPEPVEEVEPEPEPPKPAAKSAAKKKS